MQMGSGDWLALVLTGAIVTDFCELCAFDVEVIVAQSLGEPAFYAGPPSQPRILNRGYAGLLFAILASLRAGADVEHCCYRIGNSR